MTTYSPNRVGGLVRAHKAGRDGMRELARSGGRAAFAVYGDTPEARTVRALDLVKFKRMTPAEKVRLLKRRERQFGLEPGSLTSRVK